MPPKCATDTLDNPLWQFALHIYNDEAVRVRLLQLQNEHQADVLLLLLMLWLQRNEQGWPTTEVPRHYWHWREQMIWPLRRLRGQLDKQVPLRASLQQVEIEAEQQGLAYLWQWLQQHLQQQPQQPSPEPASTALGQPWQADCRAEDALAAERIAELLVVAK